MRHLFIVLLAFALSPNLWALGVKGIPADIIWETRDPVKEGLIGNPDAKVGGTLNTISILSFNLEKGWT